jgi:hypothetical protein
MLSLAVNVRDMAKRLTEEERRTRREGFMNRCPVMALLTQRRGFLEGTGDGRARWMTSNRADEMLLVIGAIATGSGEQDVALKAVLREADSIVAAAMPPSREWPESMRGWWQEYGDDVRPYWTALAAAVMPEAARGWWAEQMQEHADAVRPYWLAVAAATLRYYLTHPHRVTRYLHNGLAKLAAEVADPKLLVALDALLVGEPERIPEVLAA